MDEKKKKKRNVKSNEVPRKINTVRNFSASPINYYIDKYTQKAITPKFTHGNARRDKFSSETTESVRKKIGEL